MRKIIPAVAAGATAMALAGGFFGYAAATKDVTLTVDGSTTQVSSRADTVAEVLQARGVSVGQHDVVAPAPNAQVADGTRIAVKYGRPVTVHVDGQPRTGWTTATRVDQALAALNVDAAGAALSTNGSTAIPRRGLAVQVATLKTVTLDVAGHQRLVKTTGRTVADALRAAHLTVDADDRLSARPTASLTDGAALTYTKVDTRTLTKKQKVAYNTVHHRTGKLHKGLTRVQTSGRTGVRTLTYREIRHNGQVASRRQVHSELTTKPRTRVVLVGTKAIVRPPAVKHAPATKPDTSRHAVHKQTLHKPTVHKQIAPRQTVRKQPVRHAVTHHSSPKRSFSSPRVASGGVWDKIARCESGGNWHINTGNGFYGGLQFTLSTWRAYGGSGMPNHASRGQQIAVAKRIQASQGWGAWPACTSKLGLR